MESNQGPRNRSTHLDIGYLTKKQKLHNGEKKASSTNDADITGCQLVEGCDRSISITCTKLKFKWIKELNIETKSPEPDRRECGE